MAEIDIENVIDILIVGGGPTGILCAWEAQQVGLKPLILEQAVLTNSLYHFPDQMTFFSTSDKLEIANTPFISHHTRPTRDEALEYYRRIVIDNKIPIHTFEKVSSIVKTDEGSFIVQSNKSVYNASKVILASGYYSRPQLLKIQGESLSKVSHYYKNPHPYIGKNLAIIGAANSACDAALECWHKGANVTMFIRGSDINERVKYWIKPNIRNRIEEGSIQAYFQTEVVKITEDNIFFRSSKGEEQSISNDFVLALTGYQPDYEFLKAVGVDIHSDTTDTPVCNDHSFESNIPGLYLAGVVQCGRLTHKLYIENTRDHGRKIIQHILGTLSYV